MTPAIRALLTAAILFLVGGIVAAVVLSDDGDGPLADATETEEPGGVALPDETETGDGVEDAEPTSTPTPTPTSTVTPSPTASPTPDDTATGDAADGRGEQPGEGDEPGEPQEPREPSDEETRIAIDDMPETGGGSLLAALGAVGLAAAGAAAGRRR